MLLQTDDFISDLKRWQEAFQNYMAALSYSENTIVLYNRAIEQFIEYSLQYQEEMLLKDIKSVYITGFLSYLESEAKLNNKKPVNGQFISKSTKQTYLKAIKSLFTFISDNNNDLITFERYFKNVKIADSSKLEEKIVYLTENEIEKLLKTLELEKQKKDNYNAYRNSLLVKLLLDAGLRISEALQIKLGDFTLNDDGSIYYINICAKGGKFQKGYIARSIVEDELDYFTNIASVDSNSIIMIAKNKKPWLRNNAYQTINNIYKKSGIKKRGLHLLRHTLAMRLTKQGVSLVVIKKILRHSNISTTTIYSKAEETSIIDAAMMINKKEK